MIFSLSWERREVSFLHDSLSLLGRRRAPCASFPPLFVGRMGTTLRIIPLSHTWVYTTIIHLSYLGVHHCYTPLRYRVVYPVVPLSGTRVGIPCCTTLRYPGRYPAVYTPFLVPGWVSPAVYTPLMYPGVIAGCICLPCTRVV